PPAEHQGGADLRGRRDDRPGSVRHPEGVRPAGPDRAEEELVQTAGRLAVGPRLGGLEAGALVGAVLGTREGAVRAVGAHRLDAPVLRGGGRDVPPGVGVGHVPGLRPQVLAEEWVVLANPVADRLVVPLQDINHRRATVSRISQREVMSRYRPARRSRPEYPRSG